MLIPRSLYLRLHGLDEAFFFCSEDMDFCFRVRKAGKKIIYDPTCRILHLKNASQAWSWVRDPYLHKSRIRYFFRNRGPIAGTCAFIIVSIGILARRVFKAKGRSAA